MTSLLRELLDVLVPMQIARTLHQSKNLIYEKLKNGELPYYPVNGKYLIAKADLIDYIIEHSKECSSGSFKIGVGNGRK